MKLQFKEGVEGPVVISTGSHFRRFEAPGPFEVTDEKQAASVMASGLFEAAPKRAKKGEKK